jgi:hypothetical protein
MNTNYETRSISYCDYETQREAKVGELTLEETLAVFDNFSFTDNSFISLMIDEAHALQLLGIKDKILAEITNDGEDMIYLQKYISLEEGRTLIIHFYASDEIEDLPGFYKVPIMLETLDKIMAQNKNQ